MGAFVGRMTWLVMTNFLKVDPIEGLAGDLGTEARTLQKMLPAGACTREGGSGHWQVCPTFLD